MTEIDRVLPRPARRERSNGLPVAAERRVRKLRFASARNSLLNENQIWGNQFTGLAVPYKKLFATVDRPGLIRRKPICRSMRRRFEDPGECAGSALKICFTCGIDRMRAVNLLLSRQLVGEALIVRPAQNIPNRGRHTKSAREQCVELREQGCRLVASRKQHPPVQLIPLGEFQQVRRLYFAVSVRPRQSPSRVSRIAGQLYVWRSDHPDGHSSAAQAPGDRKAIEVSPDDQRSCRFTHIKNTSAWRAAVRFSVFERTWRLSDLGGDWFADENTVACSLAGNAAE